MKSKKKYKKLKKLKKISSLLLSKVVNNNLNDTFLVF